MDILKYLFEQIPPGWRPAVAFILLVLYVITKVRSYRKAKELESFRKAEYNLFSLRPDIAAGLLDHYREEGRARSMHDSPPNLAKRVWARTMEVIF